MGIFILVARWFMLTFSQGPRCSWYPVFLLLLLFPLSVTNYSRSLESPRPFLAQELGLNTFAQICAFALTLLALKLHCFAPILRYFG